MWSSRTGAVPDAIGGHNNALLYIIRGDTVAAYAAVPGGVSGDELGFFEMTSKSAQPPRVEKAQIQTIGVVPRVKRSGTASG
jgi:hypothetical protein